MVTTGWKLDRAQRAQLLECLPPSWPDVIADHVTLAAHQPDRTDLPPPAEGNIIGYVDDRDGLDALIVSVDGTTSRPDECTFHVTWSLDSERGRRPVQSNDVIAIRGWQTIAPIPIRLTPTYL